VRVWNLQTGECTHTLKGYTNSVLSVAFNGITIASGDCEYPVRSWHRADGIVRIWPLPYNTAECERVIERHMTFASRVWLYTAPNKHIVVSLDIGLSREGRVLVNDIRTGDRVCAPIEFYRKLS
jgi:WD40 repeat protein